MTSSPCPVSRYQRPGHCNALLLATGELTGTVFCPMGDADALHNVRDAAASFGRRDMMIQKREVDVFLDGQLFDEIEALKNEANIFLPERS
jgi:hypothetical protein